MITNLKDEDDHYDCNNIDDNDDVSKSPLLANGADDVQLSSPLRALLPIQQKKHHYGKVPSLQNNPPFTNQTTSSVYASAPVTTETTTTNTNTKTNTNTTEKNENYTNEPLEEVQHVNASMPSEPLSWREARTKMRQILEQYINNNQTRSNNNNNNEHGYEIEHDYDYEKGSEKCMEKCKLLFWCSIHNIDCYFGSILFSIIIMCVSIYFFVKIQQEQNQDQNIDTSSSNKGTVVVVAGRDPAVIMDMHKSYIVASVIFTLTSITSMWAISRRKQTSKYDVNLKRRRNVKSLLQVLNELEEAHNQVEVYPHMSMSYMNAGTHSRGNSSAATAESSSSKTDAEDIMRLPGNSLSDIYLVYRLSSNAEGRAKGQWHSVPSLLLVKGDFIALQTGDTAPADCKIVNGSRFASLTRVNNNSNKDNSKKQTQKKVTPPVVLKSGEKVEPPQRIIIPGDLHGSSTSISSNNPQMAIPWFPPGKSYLPENSRNLLHLCNNKRVFEVLEAPMSQFLHSKTVSYQSPQLHRKLWEVRSVMYLLSFLVFMLTLVIVGTRYGVVEDIPNPHHFYLPLLAALSLSPMITPLILFIQEIIGTTRILHFIQPLSSTRIRSGQNSLLDEIEPSGSMNYFTQYFTQGLRARFGFTNSSLNHRENLNLIDFPPISMCLYEKLGLVTASAFIDDELVCDPISRPEQLLVPSNNGLKLLDLYPKHDEAEDEIDKDDDDDDHFHNSTSNFKNFKENTLRRFLSSASDEDDSDSDWDDGNHEPPVVRKRRKPLAAVLRKRMLLRRKNNNLSVLAKTCKEIQETAEIQFEDPTWWRYLPSLKCIGLSCLILEEHKLSKKEETPKSPSQKLYSKTWKRSHSQDIDMRFRYFHGQAESALIKEVCQYRSQNHLRLLSKCIGFTTDSNVIGERGDISPFEERKRIHVLTTRLLQQRIKLDRHAIGFQESRSWGLLQPDFTSILIKDRRSGAHQLLTLGDARVVTDFCSDSWQGGISTITPLSLSDRREILENQRNWCLEDLDVTAFSYAPVPSSNEKNFGVNSESYLVDNRSTTDVVALTQKDVGSEDWSLLKNQIFLGLLGSSVSPRKSAAQIVAESDSSGVRFVYFSSRNMRRTKEVASEMGIDVAWNCAISLRPFDDGEDDEHRRNEYGEADVNARLPHGVEAVIRHLEEVDNVPLLVRLYTDVTKTSTAEMVQIFREHNDTVLTIGLSHNVRNDQIFSASSLAIGVDVLLPEDDHNQVNHSGNTQTSCANDAHSFTHKLCPREVSIISAITANSCVFNMTLDNGLVHISSFIAKGRTALNAGTAAAGFMIVAYTSFSLLVFLSPCSVAKSIPFIPGIGSVLYLLLVVPVIGVTMGFTEADEDSMTVVPVKNDKSISFARGERQRLIMFAIIKALLPAALSQLIYLIAFGSLIIEFDSILITEECGLTQFSWVNVIHCDILQSYAGPATISSGALVVAFHSLCTIVTSASFLLGTTPVHSTPTPLKKNKVWAVSTISCLLTIVIYLSITLESGVLQALPWYFYFLSLMFPFLCLAVCEMVKKREIQHEQRAAKMRRLHFETRLGMWSPK